MKTVKYENKHRFGKRAMFHLVNTPNCCVDFIQRVNEDIRPEAQIKSCEWKTEITEDFELPNE